MSRMECRNEPNRTAAVFAKTNVSVAQAIGDANTPLIFNLKKVIVRNCEYVKNLWLSGVDRNGYSVLIVVKDFCPSFMIRSPDSWYDDDEEAAEQMLDFVDSIHEQTKHQGSSDKINLAEFVHMTPFIGYSHNRKDRMVRLVCKNITDFGIVVKYLRDCKHIMYHEDFKPEIQFLQQTGFKYQTWLQVRSFRTFSSSSSHCCIEGFCEMKDISEAPEVSMPVPSLKVYVRMKAVSRDGVVFNRPEYRCDPNLPFDRLVAVGSAYVWHHDHTNVPFLQTIHSVIPNLDNDPNMCTYADEQTMLDEFRKQFCEMDPDEVYYFPDEFPMWEYFATRVFGQCTGGSALKLERFKSSKARVQKQKDGNDIVAVRMETRNMFNMEAALKKKVWILVESYDLYTCSCIKSFRKKPMNRAELIADPKLANRVMHQGTAGRRKLLRALYQDLQLLIDMEYDTSMFGEYSNVSNASDTDLTDVVARGEQIRVFNCLTHFCLNDNVYINRERLGEKPLKFRVSDRPPTIKDPDEIEINTRLREKCLHDLDQKLNFYGHNRKKNKSSKKLYGPARADTSSCKVKKCFAFDVLCRYATVDMFKELTKGDDDRAEGADANDDVQSKADSKEADEAEGGNVLKPSCGFWGNTRIGIFDFKSLYPSIMMGFNISYETLVFDEKYLDLPGVEYTTIQINKFETVVSADVPGIIPKMLKKFVDNRAAIKSRMKNETDKFRKQMLDFEQNAMKVLCNGTYGFTGAAKRGSLLALKTIMYMVTSLGRSLQKICSLEVGNKYGVRTIYGDSVVGATPLLLRRNHQITVLSIEQLWASAATDTHLSSQHEKQFLDLEGWESWTETGWTRVERIMRHRTDKQIIRVKTRTGVVDVTEDHSLVLSNGRPCQPGQVKRGDALMHSFPAFNTERDADGPFDLDTILNGSELQRRQFLTQKVQRSYGKLVMSVDSQGVADIEMFRGTYYDPVEALRMFALARSLKYSCRIDRRSDRTEVVITEAGEGDRKDSNTVKSMRNRGPCDGYVYDLTTENHHFHAGVGDLIVHNTDSIFVLLDMPEAYESMSIEEVTEWMGRKYGMEDFLGRGVPFVWAEAKKRFDGRKIVGENERVKVLQTDTFAFEHKVNAVFYLVCEKMTRELTAHISRPPIELDFENMATRMWMGWVKKHYCCLCWNEKDPSEVDKTKVTGMAEKKRDWTPWTRSLLKEVRNMLLNGRSGEIRGFIELQLDRLINGQVPITDLMISKGYKNKLHYKDFKHIHLQVALKTEQRTRWPTKEMSRVYFVILKGGEKLYMRGETPEYAAEHKLELDLMHYLQNQFEKPVRKLLTFHPELFNFEDLFSKYVRRLRMKQTYQTDLADSMNGTGRLLTLEDVVKGGPPKKRKVTVTLATNPNQDPFAQFRNV